MIAKTILILLATIVILASQPTAANGIISVYSYPAGMTARVSGIDVPGVSMVQMTPAVFTAPYGHYRVEVYGNQYLPQTYLSAEYNVTAENRRPVAIRAKPTPVTGDIRILAPQYASITVERIGGPLLDSQGTPYAGNYLFTGHTWSLTRLDITQFHEGNYMIKAAKVGYTPMEKTLSVDAGRSNFIVLNMQKAG